MSLLERIFWVDFASFQRTYANREPTYTCSLAVMVMFSRVGFPLLTVIIVAWFKLGFLLPVNLQIQHLSANARMIAGCTFVLVTYVWLYRRFLPCVDDAPAADSYDTPANKRLAGLSMALAVCSLVIGWLAIKFVSWH